MKHTRNRLLALALALTMALSTLATGTLAVQQTDRTASTAVTTMAVKTSGKCGKNVKWSYDKKTKTVTISGKGAMANYGDMDTFAPPWYDLDVRKIVVKKGVTTIGDKAFAHCGNLQSVTIPEGVTSLGMQVFLDSPKLSTVTLPKSLKKVNKAAFYGAYVSAYKVASGNKYFSAAKGVLFNKKKTSLVAYPLRSKATSYTIPKTVKSIEPYAFSMEAVASCKLKKLIVPTSVTSVKNDALCGLYNCKVYFKGKAPKNLYKGLGNYASITIYYVKKYESGYKAVKNAVAKQVKKDPFSELEVYFKTWKG
jgi:hypothetical protein